MNPLTNVRNIAKLNEDDLRNNRFDHNVSWHSQYKDSAYIFIGGLPYDLTEGDVLCVFSQYGEVVNINLVRDKKTGKFKGYGFLCYEDQRSTILAVDNFNGIKLGGRTIRVDHVSQYRVPKSDEKDDFGNYKDKVEIGCAPQTPSPELISNKETKHKKKKKVKDKKKKKKNMKKSHQDSSGSDSQSNQNDFKTKILSSENDFCNKRAGISNIISTSRQDTNHFSMTSERNYKSNSLYRSQSYDHDKNISSINNRNCSRDMVRSRNRSREKKHSRSRSREKKHSRSRSREKKRNRSRSRDMIRSRSRSNDRIRVDKSSSPGYKGR